MYQSKIYFCCGYVEHSSLQTFIIRVRSGQIRFFFTVYFHFTEDIPDVTRIPLRIGRMSSVVVVDDVSPVVRTGDVNRIRYSGSGVLGVPKTHHSVLFVCCVGDVHRESQEIPSVVIIFI